MRSAAYEAYIEPIQYYIRAKGYPGARLDEIQWELEYLAECVQDIYEEGYMPTEDYVFLMGLLYSENAVAA